MIKMRGIISGHDYGSAYPGVKKAIHEILGKPIEILLLKHLQIILMKDLNKIVWVKTKLIVGLDHILYQQMNYKKIIMINL